MRDRGYAGVPYNFCSWLVSLPGMFEYTVSCRVRQRDRNEYLCEPWRDHHSTCRPVEDTLLEVLPRYLFISRQRSRSRMRVDVVDVQGVGGQ